MTDDVRIALEYKINTSNGPININLGTVVGRTEYTNPITSPPALIVDTHVIEALAGQNDLDYLLTANRTIVVPQAVEEELSYNWRNSTDGGIRDTYVAWRNQNIADQRLRVETNNGDATPTLYDFPEPASRSFGEDYADAAIYQLYGFKYSGQLFNDRTLILTNDTNKFFNRDWLESNDLPTGHIDDIQNAPEFFLNTAIAGSITPEQFFEIAPRVGTGNASSNAEAWTQLASEEFGARVSLRDGNGAEIGYIGLNPSGKSVFSFDSTFGDETVTFSSGQRMGLRADDSELSFWVETLTLGGSRKVIKKFIWDEATDSWNSSTGLFDLNADPFVDTPVECFCPKTSIDMWPFCQDLELSTDGTCDQNEIRSRIWTKPIEDITTDDLILTYDSNGNPVPGRVSKLFSNTTSEFIRLCFEDREDLIATPGHRFLTETGDYMEIGHILRLSGGTARLVDKSGAVVEAVGEVLTYSAETAHHYPESEVKSVAYEGNAVLKTDARKGWTTYNFEVAEHHNYVAGGIRVHNDSALSFVESNEFPTDIKFDPTGTRIVSYEADLQDSKGNFFGNVTVVTQEFDNGDTTVVERKYEISRGAGRETEITVVNVEKKNDDGENEVVSSQITELNINGSKIGAATLKSLTPFLSSALIGDDASILSRVATDTILSTLLGNVGEYIGGVWDVKLSGLGEEVTTGVNGTDTGDVIDALGEDLFSDLETDLAINGITSTVSIVNQLITAEIFGELELDGVGGAVAEAFISTGANYLLTQGAKQLLDTPFFEDVLGNFGADIEKVQEAFGAGNPFTAPNLVSVALKAVLAEILPDIETLEGAAASAAVGALVTSFLGSAGAAGGAATISGFSGSFAIPAAGPIGLVVGLAIGKIFDKIFEKSPQAWANVGFNSNTGKFEITGTWVNDGGDTELSQSLAQSFIDSMNEFVDAVKSQSHNFNDLAKWSFGHYEDFVSNMGRQGYHFEDFQENYLNAYVSDLAKAQLNDGQMTAVRAIETLDVAKLREEHRLKLFLDALKKHDIVTSAQQEIRHIPGGEGGTDYGVFVEREATNFRQKLAYFANDGSDHWVPLTGDVGHEGDGYTHRSPFRTKDGNHVTEIADAPGNAPQDAKRYIDVHTKLAIDQFTKSQVLKDFLNGSSFQTYQEFLTEFDLPEKTYDDEEIFGLVASNLQIAHDYNTYLENTETINSIIEAAPESNFAAGWIQTLVAAKDLALHEAFDLTGDEVNNIFLTADGHDNVVGKNGNDLFKTYGGEDALIGGNGNDSLSGGNGNDNLDGGYSNDRLNGGAGADALSGGRGSDIFVFQTEDGADTISDFELQDDLLRFIDVQFADLTISQDGSDVVIAYGADDEVTVSNANASDFDETRFRFGPEEETDSHEPENNELLRLFVETLNKYDVVTSTGTENRHVPGGEGGTYYSVFVEYEATSFRQKLAYFANDGSDHNVPLTGDIGHEGDGYTLRSPFRAKDGSQVTEIADAVGTAPQDAKSGFSAQTKNAIAQYTKSQVLKDFLATSDFQSYSDFSNEFNFVSDGNDVYRGSRSDDLFKTHGGKDLAIGYEGNDQIWGGSGNDTLIGGKGHDILSGGSGADVFSFSLGDGADAINDFDTSADLIRFNGLQFSDLTIIQSGQDVDISYGASDNVRVLNSNASQFTQSKFIFGTFGTGDANLVGSAGANNLVGGYGYDSLTGGMGNDTLKGEGGSDTYFWSYGDGNDVIHDEGGSIEQIDTLVLTDVLMNDVSLRVKNNNHLMVAIASVDGSEVIQVSAQYANTSDGRGIERIEFSDGVWGKGKILENARLNGTAGNNTLTGTDYRDNIHGLGGNDRLESEGGNDHLIGGEGNDTLLGANGNDTYYWSHGDGNDVIYDTGSSVSQTDKLVLTDVDVEDVSLSIKNGNHLLITIQSANGDEVIQVSAQFTDHENGVGLERIDFRDDVWTKEDIYSRVDIKGTNGNDTLIGSEYSDNIYGRDGKDSIKGLEGNDHLFGDANRDTLKGGDGDDHLDGGSSNDTLYGGTGDDHLIGGTGTEDYLDGGEGSDTYFWSRGDSTDVLNETDASTSSIDTLVLSDVLSTEVTLHSVNNTSSDDARLAVKILGDGGDTLRILQQYSDANGNQGIEKIEFSDGVIWNRENLFEKAKLTGNDNDNTLTGSEYRDNIYGLNGKDSIKGLEGNDHLFGDAGRDTLKGGAGDDYLNGGAGRDSLVGGSGSDQFIFEDSFGYDTISDFDIIAPNELIDLSGVSAISDFSDLTANHLTQTGSHTVIGDGGGHTITLLNINKNDLTADDFLF